MFRKDSRSLACRKFDIVFRVIGGWFEQDIVCIATEDYACARTKSAFKLQHALSSSCTPMMH